MRNAVKDELRLRTIAKRDDLNRWINQEHTLLSNRMGWLLSANAFLFGPVAIIITRSVSESSSTLKAEFLLKYLCILGLTVAIALGIPMVLAVHTMTVVRHRYSLLLTSLKDAHPVLLDDLRFVDPEQQIWNDASSARWKCSHKLSMLCQLVVPVLLANLWLYVLLAVVWQYAKLADYISRGALLVSLCESLPLAFGGRWYWFVVSFAVAVVLFVIWLWRFG